MSTSRDRVRQALSHQGSDRIPVDFGGGQGFGRRNGRGLYWSRRYKRYL